MDDVRDAFVEDIIAIFVGVIPGGAALRGTTRALAQSLAGRRRDEIRQIAESVFDGLYNSVGLDSGNPGAARSSAYDVLDTIRKAALSVETLIDTCLDADLLAAHRGQCPASGIEHAFAQRKHLYDIGFKRFCHALTHDARSMPAMQGLISSRLLKQQKQILAFLESHRVSSHEGGVA